MNTLIRLSAVACALSVSSAWAQGAAGVSDERMRLPQAPGSISGVGENAAVEGNQGGLQYRVAVDVPPGFPGVTPTVAFNYSSSGGAGALGMGWSMATFSIERMTSRGLQKYVADDRIVVDGSDELVRVSQSGSTAVYRARFEGSFVRYTWLNAGAGGTWKAEFPDGRVGYYGADELGVEVPTSQVRVPSSPNVFRWHLVAMLDAWGHAMRLSWTKDSTGMPLLERIDYLYEGGVPRHSVRFTWEPRTDVLSDARSGFDLRLTQRLKDVRIFSGTSAPEQVRRYVLAYELDADSGGPSRLKGVTRFGRGDVLYPVAFGFGYSKTLGGACAGNCDKPFVADMGTVPGVDFSTGRATLLDINGDALPDVLFSDVQGRHQFFTASLDSEGKASFRTAPIPSTKTTGSSPFIIGDSKVQVLDVNGDGFMDITQAKVPAVLCNNGSGDWVDASFCTATAGGPGLPAAFDPADVGVATLADATQADPRNVRFFDYDNDKRIDWLRTPTGSNTTEVLANTPAGFVSTVVASIGAAFDDSPLELADMNGDGLQDPTEVLVSGSAVTVQYKLNLGYGNWDPVSSWRTVVLSGFTPSQAALAELQDIDGDGLADVVAVTGTEVAFALNRNGEHFDMVRTITTADLGSGGIPQRTPTTVVVFADMNGNGSDDIVWIQPSGAVSYLELFPVRPNLISRIDNGIGAVQLIRYGTSIFEQGRDTAANKPWLNRVPNPMTVVTRVDTFVTLTGNDSGGLRETTLYRYHSGYYDGVEKQFRGYEGVERELPADAAHDAQEPGLFVLDYDVGKSNAAFAGLMKTQTVYAGAGASLALLKETRSLYGLCPVAEVPVTTPAIVHACDQATTTVLTERDAAHAVTTRTEREYDGYGNVVRERELGVVNLGTPEAPTGCAACTASGAFGVACGPTCTGDEQFSETDFVVPGADTNGAWLISRPTRTASGAVATSLLDERLSFYDGPAFEGLPTGKLTRGGLTRVMRRSGPGAQDFLAVERLKLDAHGNTVELIAPNGTVADATNWRRLYSYEPAGVNLVGMELRLADAAGAPTVIKRDLRHDASFEVISQSSAWYAVVGGAPASTPPLTRYRYDEHGQLISMLDPGDADATPAQQFKFDFANPASSISVLRRSTAGGPQDLVTVQCLDGKGRNFQQRTRLTDTRWQVSGFSEFDAHGAVVRNFQPYVGTSGTCDTTAPTMVPFTSHTFDALGRELTETQPDGAIRRTSYGPLSMSRFDPDANDPASPHFNVPVVQRFDGLGRLVASERHHALPGTGTPATTRLEYDAQGNLAAVRDPGGNLHAQAYDLLQRLVSVSDPNSGTTRFEYDANGNQARVTNARGAVTLSTFDTGNRVLSQWDPADEAGSKRTWRYDLKPTGCTECTNLGGRLAEATWPTGGDRFGYDTRNNEVFTERTLEGRAFVTRTTWDAASRRLSVAHPGGLTVAATHDGDSRVSALSGFVTNADYDERGELKAVAFANGASTAFTYDDSLRLTSLKSTAKDGTAFLDLGFSRGRNGSLKAITDGPERTGRARHAAAFEYDALKRVTRISLERSGAEAETLTFGFDDLDNVTSQVSSLGASSRAHQGDYAYGSSRPNAVTHAGALDLTYGASGALETRGTTTYAYDGRGRLTAAEGGAETGHFSYGTGFDRVITEAGDSTSWTVSDDLEVLDGISQLTVKLGDIRVARAQSDALASVVLSDLAPATITGGSASPQGNQVIDISDAWLAQAASTGTLSFSGGPTPSKVTALLRSSARRLLMQDVVWLHADHLESVVAATGADGLLRAERSFYPMGVERSSGAFVDEAGFEGQVFEASTGLVHHGYRELDPELGRWSSVDPAFEELSADDLERLGEATSAYAFVANDFPNATDPTGLARAPSGGGSFKNKALKSIGKGAWRGAKFVGKGAWSGAKAVGGGAKDLGKWAGSGIAAGARNAKATFKANPGRSSLKILSGLLSLTGLVTSIAGAVEGANGNTGLASDLSMASRVTGGTATVITLGMAIHDAASPPSAGGKQDQPLQKRSVSASPQGVQALSP